MGSPEGKTCREEEAFERNKYFYGKLMTARDFEDEQAYHIEKRKHHNRYLHGYGIVCGLRVVPTQPPQRRYVMVEPGVALDPWGRDIVVCEPTEFELIGRGEPDPCDKSNSLYVVLEYREADTEPVPVPNEPCGSEEDTVAPSRIMETFQLSLRQEPPEGEDRVSRRICEALMNAIREGVRQEELHRLLCECVSHPCRPSGPDPALTLARIDIPAEGSITAEQIDNYSHRHLALSVEQILRILLYVAMRPAR
jgi:hypothetical protein